MSDFAHVLRMICVSAVLALSSVTAAATDLRVVVSGGFAQAYKDLTPAYEQSSGDHLISGWGPSMGNTVNAIPARLARGEPIDVVIMVGDALDRLMDEGKLQPGSKVVLANSLIACAVRSGSPQPDIRTVEGLKSAFLNARKVAYSDSASGEYIRHRLMQTLQIEVQMQGKAAQIPATPVGEILARGEADFGCQQHSELLPVQGITIVGLIPDQVQLSTPFAAAIVKGSQNTQAAQKLLHFLSAPASAAAIRATGLAPVSTP